ncbi:OprO/OprP family phosphate-selective porin [Phenylobacterium sp. LjRoot164]|uniref:OprO/OprP family phosphate-selective porin n=1 Tax=unclassified Phenylobacterium TaxID=2640670 RepID=UPI003ECC8CC2
MYAIATTSAALAAAVSGEPSPPPTQSPAPVAAPADAAAQADSGGFSLAPLLDLDFRLGPWTFHGYLQYDGAIYDQAAEGPPESDFRRGGVDLGDPLRARNLSDGSYLRRARLGWEGSHGDHIAYRAMFEFGDADEAGEARVAEVWASYIRKPYSIRVGAFSPPTNMEGATSSDSNLFLERATAADLARSLGGGDGRVGVTVRRVVPGSMAALSLTGPPLDSGDDYAPRAAILGRYTRAFKLHSDYRIHLGVNGTFVLTPTSESDPGRPDRFPVRFLNTPEIDVDDTPLIDTGEIDADQARILGLEFAAQRRNFYLQAEGFLFGVKRHGPEPGDPQFSGFYVQGSWILTGETRRFDQSLAAFSFPKPLSPIGGGGWGALELAFRYSVMDLNDHEGAAGQPTPTGGVRGGRQEILGAAVLWYPRPRVRVMFNYLHVNVDRLNPAGPDDPDPFGPVPSTPPIGVQIGQNLDIMAVRIRYSF